MFEQYDDDLGLDSEEIQWCSLSEAMAEAGFECADPSDSIRNLMLNQFRDPITSEDWDDYNPETIL